MNRRSFLKSLGFSIATVAILSKVPPELFLPTAKEVLTPKEFALLKEKLLFEHSLAMERAFFYGVTK